MKITTVNFTGVSLVIFCRTVLQIQCFMDVEIAHWNWSQTLFDDAPKDWIRYIEKLLQHFLSNCNKKKPTQYCLESVEIQAKFFKENKWYKKTLSKYRTVCDCKNYDDTANMFGSCWHVPIKEKRHASKFGYNPNFCTLQNSTTLHPPTGRIAHNAIEQGKHEQFEGPACWDCLLIKPERYTIAMTWQIEAESIFSTKLLFQKIDIDIFKMYSSCSLGNISVINHADHLNRSEDHLICGKHSPVNVYSRGHHCSFVLVYYHLVGVEIEVAFTLVTVDVIHSRLHQLTGASVQSSTIYYLPRLEAKLWSYHIQMAKHQKVHLELLVETVLVHIRLYDGPGTHTRHTQWDPEASNKMYLSTFQCLLQIYHPLGNGDCGFKTQIGFKTYFTVIPPQFLNISQSKQELEIPQKSDKSFRQDVFVINSAPYKHINISITNVFLVGTETSSCTFGGISFLNHDKNKISEVSSICKNITSASCKSKHLYSTHRTFHSCPRHIYSSGRKMYIAVFSYKEYGSISAHLKIAETKCKAVRIHVCKFNELCPNRPEECLQFLKQTFKQVEVSGPDSLTFDVDIGQCQIFQIGNDLFNEGPFLGRLHKHPPFCQISLLANNTPNKSLFTFNIFGMMTSRLVPMPPRRISRPEIHLPVTKFSFSFFLQQHTVEEVPEHFFFSFEVVRPFLHSVPTVHIDSSFISNIWMDMIVENSEETNRSDDKIEMLKPSISAKNVKQLSALNNAVLVLELSNTEYGQCSISKYASEIAVMFLKLKVVHGVGKWIELSLTIDFSCAEPVKFVSVLKQEFMSQAKYRISTGRDIVASWMYISGETSKERRFCPSQNQSQSTFSLSSGCLYHVTKLEGDKKLWSWQKASDFCEEINGHLPVFMDKQDIEELIHQLKAKETHLQAPWCVVNVQLLLFIGLKVRH